MKEEGESNSETDSVWTREESQNFIRYGRLNVTTAYETLCHFIDIYLSIPFTSVRSST